MNHHLPDPLKFLAMILPLLAGTAENIGHVIGGGSNAKGIGVPLIGTIGVLLLYPLPLPLGFNKFESFVTPSIDEFLDSRFFGSNLLIDACSHNFVY